MYEIIAVYLIWLWSEYYGISQCFRNCLLSLKAWRWWTSRHSRDVDGERFCILTVRQWPLHITQVLSDKHHSLLILSMLNIEVISHLNQQFLLSQNQQLTSTLWIQVIFKCFFFCIFQFYFNHKSRLGVEKNKWIIKEEPWAVDWNQPKTFIPSGYTSLTFHRQNIILWQALFWTYVWKHVLILRCQVLVCFFWRDTVSANFMWKVLHATSANRYIGIWPKKTPADVQVRFLHRIIYYIATSS